jgi:hypothetical protein
VKPDAIPSEELEIIAEAERRTKEVREQAADLRDFLVSMLGSHSLSEHLQWGGKPPEEDEAADDVR